MSFLDNFKSHKKNNEQAVEQEFQRGLREGSWPEGVSDFQLMDNTGTFLPAYPDPDPHAEADAFVQEHAGEGRADWSVVRAAGSTRSEGGFRVIEGSAAGRAAAKPAGDAPAPRRPIDDEGVQVMPRSDARPARSAAGASASQKSYAERLRERVAADAAARPAPQPVTAPAPAPSKRPVPMQEPAVPAVRPAAAEPRPAAPAKPAAVSAPAPAPTAASAHVAEPPTFSSDAVIVRTRGYDDVRRVAEVLLGDHRPVVLAMRSSSDATCQRILDFTFGVCCASGATIEELGQKLFAVCPKGVKVSDVTMADLKRQGLMR